NQENAGLSAARNRGIEAAKGKYILFVDSDDLVVPEMIMTIASGFEQSDSEVVTFSYSRFMETPENRKFEVISKNLKAKEYPSMEYFKLVLEIPTIQWIPAWTYAFNLEFLRTNNLRFKKGLLHEDVEFFPRMVTKASSITVMSSVLYNYRIRSGSITTSLSKLEQSLSDQFFIIESLDKLCRSIDNPLKKNLLQKYVSLRVRVLTNKCMELSSENVDGIYKELKRFVARNRKQKQLLKKDFYYNYLESKNNRRLRLFKENLFKWPRRIYKFKIKPWVNK
ncbi:MAG TPA: hypothetical protein DDY13_14420, partial [Cytophagales bacterium]|nr:hypothetical protein [Cytophagales bacterium]